MENKIINVNELDALVIDFDGVLTNDRVYLDENGVESVRCHRGDGLAFDVLRKLNIPAFILSTEKNSVVAMRAKKLKIQAIQGISNKVTALLSLIDTECFNIEKVLYVGNDLNDYRVMQLCGFTACPADSHEKIKQVSTVILKTNGGDGVVRELIEQVMDIDIVKIMYTE